MAAATSHEGHLRIEVLALLVAEDLYGKKHLVSEADAAVWSSAEEAEVLFEGDLGSGEFTGYVGSWNVKFLKWLKTISVATANWLYAAIHAEDLGRGAFEKSVVTVANA